MFNVDVTVDVNVDVIDEMGRMLGGWAGAGVMSGGSLSVVE